MVVCKVGTVGVVDPMGAVAGGEVLEAFALSPPELPPPQAASKAAKHTANALRVAGGAWVRINLKVEFMKRVL